MSETSVLRTELWVSAGATTGYLKVLIFAGLKYLKKKKDVFKGSLTFVAYA